MPLTSFITILQGLFWQRENCMTSGETGIESYLLMVLKNNEVKQNKKQRSTTHMKPIYYLVIPLSDVKNT